ncbi:MAG TPA: adenylate/guanylate cyclase domain-containing protein [Chloroflexota bacterium]|nr:adenylate/guanylate cyclase domain-containing protein [Chloroflexota bacterium]
MTRRDRRRLVISTSVSVVVAVALTIALWNGAFATLQAATSDVFFQTWLPTGVKDTSQRVVVVAIDDPTIHELGRLGEWPRRYYADVVDRLREGFAREIAFDIGFVEPNEDDQLVADALKRFLETPPEDLQRAGVPLGVRSVISPIVGIPNTARTVHAGSPTTFPDSLRPRPVFVDVSTALGHSNVIPDGDGVVRKTPALIQVSGELFPSLGIAAAAAYTNTLGRGYRIATDAQGIYALNRFIPTDPFLDMVVSYAGPPSHVDDPAHQTFKVVSFVDVMNGRVDPAVFRDKMVFIGVLDATGLADDYQVPTSSHFGKMAGVEIHANAFATATAARFFTEQQIGVTTAIVWAMCLMTGLVVFRLSIVLSAIGTLVLGLGYFFGSLVYAGISYDPLGVAMPNLVYPPAALLLTFLSVAVYRVVFEQAEARATRGAMGKYLSPSVLAEVLRDPDRLHLGGEKRVMTVLFTDIRGFTSISERLEPEVLVHILNEYLTVMTDVVHRWEGVLDKYMGDAIMAWWGAPTEQPDHAYRACMTALEMRRALRTLHEEWAARGVPKMEMGVGINTGPMVYGNTGSLERFDFTVLGDAVNLASRLEGANKEYGSNVIVSGSTRDQVADRGFVMRFLDLIEVKGKMEPVEIFELLGIADQLDASVHLVLGAWDRAMALYRTREFSLAEGAFRDILAQHPDDGPAQVYVDRCVQLRENPPHADWDGVFVMTHK